MIYKDWATAKHLMSLEDVSTVHIEASGNGYGFHRSLSFFTNTHLLPKSNFVMDELLKQLFPTCV